MTDKVSDHLFECLLKGLTPEIYTEFLVELELVELVQKVFPRLIRNKLGDIDEELCIDLASELYLNMEIKSKE